MVKTLKKMYKRNPLDQFVIFMDIVPDNEDTATVYRQLQGVIDELGCDAIILPVHCQEFTALQSFSDTPLVRDASSFDTLSEYAIVPKWKSLPEYRHIKNYEKLCKHFLYNFCRECVEDSSINFFSVDCVCDSCDDFLSEVLTLEEKALRFTVTWACLSQLAKQGVNGKLCESWLAAVHMRLCIAHNMRVGRYWQNSNQSTVFLINPMDRCNRRKSCAVDLLPLRFE